MNKGARDFPTPQHCCSIQQLPLQRECVSGIVPASRTTFPSGWTSQSFETGTRPPPAFCLGMLCVSTFADRDTSHSCWPQRSSCAHRGRSLLLLVCASISQFAVDSLQGEEDSEIEFVVEPDEQPIAVQAHTNNPTALRGRCRRDFQLSRRTGRLPGTRDFCQ